jgi:Inhibitor of apoptosis-promoting Bax1
VSDVAAFIFPYFLPVPWTQVDHSRDLPRAHTFHIPIQSKHALLQKLQIFISLQWDFSGMGPFLFAGLVGLIMTGFVGMFFPFSKTWDLVYGVGGSLLFSGYIVFDVS